MCGRYTLRLFRQDMEQIFQVIRSLENWEPRPRYNIAPTQSNPVVRLDRDGNRELLPMRWGLIPSWAKDAKIGYSLINARADSVATKPSFRSAFKSRRCLVPADGFYEWKNITPKEKQPFHIHLRSGKPFAFAGLWESWHARDGSEIDSYTIVTTDANPMMANLHDRMPVILKPDDYDSWLKDAERAPELLRQYPENELETYEVDKAVGNVKNDSPRFVEPPK